MNRKVTVVGGAGNVGATVARGVADKQLADVVVIDIADQKAAGVALDIFDDGEPFDPRGAPDSGRPPSGTRPAPGVVGIQLVKKLVDDFAYERIAGRNHTRLIKKWAANPGVKEIDP